jgi:hypothetical protein
LIFGVHICSPADAIAKPPTATTFRIKLVDDTRKNQSANQMGRGAGAKNLSRMNRPAEIAGAAADSAKHKPVNQIPINIFWNHVETFFKPLDDIDMKFLGDSSVNLSWKTSCLFGVEDH